MMAKLERIIVRLDVPSHWNEGKILKFLQTDPGLDFKEAVLRALRGYYLPEALEDELEPVQFRRVVEAAIADLQYRAFQLQLQFCPDMPLMLPAQVMAGMTQLPYSQCLQSASLARNSTPTEDGSAVETTITQMRESLSDVDLNQVLDDF
ncbi:MAG: hypothetical protein KME12_18055 [Trichocoleus desertorum ATA4-8-CV12]|jgi:hypothetical protein|nr:hypothetical protein [Trichocoleus desertorum ATA4-8-CV12]